MKNAEESSAASAPEMVNTTETTKQVRFEEPPSSSSSSLSEKDNLKPLTLVQALLLNRRLRRMKRRLFLDAVADKNNIEGTLLLVGANAVSSSSSRDEEQQDAFLTTVNKQPQLLSTQESLDSSTTSLEPGSESQDQAE